MRVLSEGYRVASVDHICDYCGCKIPKGHRYYYISCEINGDIINAKVKKTCLVHIDNQYSFLIKESEILVPV